MDTKEYQQSALVTESVDFEAIWKRLESVRTMRLMHGCLGVQTEAGEFADAVKRHIFYGKPLDATNLAEEVGDLFWYIAIICDALGVSFDEVMEKNIAKLKARYGGKFTEHRALNRDLGTERAILEE